MRFAVVLSVLVFTSGCVSCAPECMPCEPGGKKPTKDFDGGVDDAGAPVDGGDEDCGCVAPERMFPTLTRGVEQYPACHLASPLAYEGGSGSEVLMSVGDRIVGVDPLTGQKRWNVTLPAPEGEMAFVTATPYLVGHRLVVGYHTTSETDGNRDVNARRHRQRVAVIDLEARALDDAFAPVELSGQGESVDGEPVPFEPGQALGRAALVGGKLPGDELGKVYVTFGNARDIQPWHGFAFEIDLDVWLADGPDAAVTGFLVDTPEGDCGTPGSSGSRHRICGGGFWAPSGPLLLPRDDGYELILASGNGQLDLERDDYANTLMRTGPGLGFDAGCDPEACAGFDPDAPAQACVESCANLFIPRMPDGEDFTELVSGGRCEGDTMFECWAKLDYIGGSTPAYATTAGFELLLYPGKDGAVYLVDKQHLGTMYERRQLVSVCGTETSTCTMDWAGMIVTQPTMTTQGGAPLALVPTFMPDGEQEAAVFALKIVVQDGVPRLEEAWRWPEAGSEEAKRRFRSHSSRVALATLPDGSEVALLVEPGNPGRLIALDVETGALLADEPLSGRGYRFVMPLVVEDRVYVPSCEGNAGASWLEGFRLWK